MDTATTEFVLPAGTWKVLTGAKNGDMTIERVRGSVRSERLELTVAQSASLRSSFWVTSNGMTFTADEDRVL